MNMIEVGNINRGISNLKSVLQKCSTNGQYGLILNDGIYVVCKKPVEFYHIANEYDIEKNGVQVFPVTPMKLYFSRKDIQNNLDICLSNKILRSYLQCDLNSQSLVLWHYNMEQLELLYEYVNTHVSNFYLEMNDHWSSDDYVKSHNYKNKLNKLLKLYNEKYGNLPEWEYIDDVMNTQKELKKLIEGV